VANLIDKFNQALSRRDTLGSDTTVKRLVDGVGDGLPGLYLDSLGATAIAHIQSDHDHSSYRELLLDQKLFEKLQLNALFLRQRFSDASKSADCEAELLWGSDAETALIQEHGVAYQIYPKRYVNAGFFIDMREVRRTLVKNSAGKRVLNLFCYTGSLGMSAAVGGASHIVQVDISKGILALARENQQLNQQNISGEMRFIPEDSFVFLEKESRRIERGNLPYDVVIVDPPSFSRSKQGTFQIERDIKALFEGVLAVAAQRATIFATTNLAMLEPEDVLKAFQAACEITDRKILSHRVILPPEDFNAPLALSIATRGVQVEIG
jgi:23S rRNA (cytosine1962-C5)-methyltransferase